MASAPSAFGQKTIYRFIYCKGNYALGSYRPLPEGRRRRGRRGSNRAGASSRLTAGSPNVLNSLMIVRNSVIRKVIFRSSVASWAKPTLPRGDDQEPQPALAICHGQDVLDFSPCRPLHVAALHLIAVQSSGKWDLRQKLVLRPEFILAEKHIRRFMHRVADLSESHAAAVRRPRPLSEIRSAESASAIGHRPKSSPHICASAGDAPTLCTPPLQLV